MVLLALIAAAAPWTQADTVTLTVTGATPRHAIEKLAEKTGLKLFVDDSANKCTLVLRLDHAPIEEALDKIAEATSSKWVEKDDTLTLKLDPEIVKKEGAEEARIRLESITKQKEEATKGIASTEDYIAGVWALANRIGEFMASYTQTQEDYDNLKPFADQAPVSRLARRILKAVDAKVIADIPENEVIVYSSRPSRLERPFPSATSGAFDDFAKEAIAWSDAATESLAKIPQRFQEDPRAYSAALSTRIALFLMEIARDPQSGTCTVRLCTFNDEGRQTGDCWVGLSSSDVPEGEIQRGILGAVEQPPDAYCIAHSTAMLGYGSLPEGTDRKAELEKWRKRILDCEHDDPIGYLPGRLLTESSRVAGKQLVALVPDEALQWLLDGAENSPPKLTGDELVSMVTKEWRCRVGSAEAWVTASPSLPVKARQNYLQREPLAELLKSMAELGTIELDPILKYAREQTGAAAFGGADWWLANLFTSVWGNVDQAWPLLAYCREPIRLVASLAAAEQQAALSDRGIPIEQLSKGTREKVFSGVYGLSKLGELKHVMRPDRPATTNGVDLPWFVDSWPTHALPDGIPRGATLKLKLERSALVVFKPLPGTSFSMPLAEAADRAGMWITNPAVTYDVTQMQVRPMGILKLTLELGDYKTERSLNFAPAVDGNEWVALDEVEQPYRGMIEDSIRKYQALRRDGG